MDRTELARMTRKTGYFKSNRAGGSGKCSLQTDAISRSSGIADQKVPRSKWAAVAHQTQRRTQGIRITPKLHFTFKHHNATRVKLWVSLVRVLLSAGGKNIHASIRITPGGSYATP